MNDKDKEALKERLSSMGFPDENSYLFYHKAWKAACEHKDSEHNNAKKFSDTEVLLAKLTIENAKLREAVEVLKIVSQFSDHDAEVLGLPDGEAPTEASKLIKRARQVLKELEEE